MPKTITLIYNEKASPVKLKRFSHPILVKTQMDMTPEEVIYLKIRALRDTKTGSIIRLKPHEEYPTFYHIDPSQVKEGGTYEILVRDYRQITRDLLSKHSIKVLQIQFGAFKNQEGYITYSDTSEFFNLKKRRYKRLVETQMNNMYEDLDAIQKVQLKKDRIHDMARAQIEKGEDVIEDIAKIVFLAMNRSKDGKVTFEEFADHWAKMLAMTEDMGSHGLSHREKESKKDQTSTEGAEPSPQVPPSKHRFVERSSGNRPREKQHRGASSANQMLSRIHGNDGN